MDIGIQILVIVFQIAVVLGGVLTHIAYLTLAERKILSDMQDRLGPMEVGPHGLLQPLADGLKLFFKEDIIPAGANKFIFSAAPILVLVPALIGFAVVPFGRDSLFLGDIEITPYIADINIGILYVLAFASIGAYGILLGGWASNSKYALLGGLRSAAQCISYELPLGLALVGPILLSESLSMKAMTEAQGGGFWHWFIVVQPVAFVIYMICAIAETNRLPFDLPEAESELVAGFFTEYSGMRFSLFFLAEYGNMILVSCIAVVAFLGGWQAPFSFLEFIPPIIWFLAKVYFLLFFYIWLRATVPRLRFDQLMAFCWKVMLPLALVNVLVTSIVKYIVS
ncbi:NADH-ubiquinone oxidoreductase chain H [hydrothermal vent metagenome]|uniref:NADH-ubiquinone oxidoreductase chain H n=1 Tax=hydrothermal vent metagenome TaxID=652676 RepID=A0A3B1DVL4_9ZZZZ|nr:NADH-quinone oxidoreductase subunit NuoH [Candidatus Manganitrophaceae bacterium]